MLERVHHAQLRVQVFRIQSENLAEEAHESRRVIEDALHYRQKPK